MSVFCLCMSFLSVCHICLPEYLFVFNLSNNILVCQNYLFYNVLKVLTQRSFLFKIRFYTPKEKAKHIPKKNVQKKTLKNDFENPSELLPILAGSLLLLLIGFLLWLPPSQRLSAHLSASRSPISNQQEKEGAR